MQAAIALETLPASAPAAVRRIMLIDDHAIVREGVRSLFEEESDLVVSAEAGSGDEALLLLDTLSIDLAITDLRMPGMSPSASVTAMRAKHPKLRVLVLTSFFDEAEIHKVLLAGASGIVLKDANRNEIIAAARAVADGEDWIHPSLISRVLQLLRHPIVRPSLARREMQVLELLGKGHSNKRIASLLGIAEGTVKGYLREIYPKIGVNDRLQAALYARGLQEPI